MEFSKIYIPPGIVKNTINEPSLNFSHVLFYHQHQRFVRTFLGPHTTNTRILCKHGTGTGKTLVSLLTALQYVKLFKLYDPEDQPSIFVIGFNKEMFYDEIIKRPELGYTTQEEKEQYAELLRKAVSSDQDKAKLSELRSTLKRRLSIRYRDGFFKFVGYKELFNRLFNTESVDPAKFWDLLRQGTLVPDWDVVKGFANSAIICDEIQDTYNASDYNVYGLALRFIFNCYSDATGTVTPATNDVMKGIPIPKDILPILQKSTIVAMLCTATPVENSAVEIVDLINLLVPGADVKKSDLFDSNLHYLKGVEPKIARYLAGHVSFLQDNRPEYYPQKRFAGTAIKGIEALKFVKLDMPKMQKMAYDLVYNGAIRSDSTAVLDIVYPPLTKGGEPIFRSHDIRRLVKEPNDEWMKEHDISIRNGILAGNFLKEENLRKYSAKLADCVSRLHKNLREQGGKVLITHQLVENGGVKLIGEVLESNGFVSGNTQPSANTLCSVCGRRYDEHKEDKDIARKSTTPSLSHFLAARYEVLHGELDKLSIWQIEARFNQPSNADGNELRVIVGSKMLFKGVDFNALRGLIVISVPPDIATLLQEIGRGVRKKSHSLLDPSKRFLDIALPIASSYEEDRYKAIWAEYKSIQIGNRIMNSVAIDAGLYQDTIFPNKNKDIDALGTPYFHVNPPKRVTKPENRYQYYNTEEIEDVLVIVKRLFVEQSRVWKYKDLLAAVRQPPFDMYYDTTTIQEDNFLVAMYILTSRSVTVGSLVREMRIVDEIRNRNATVIHVRGIPHRITAGGDMYFLVPIVEDTEPSSAAIGVRYDKYRAPDADIERWHPVANEASQFVDVSRELVFDVSDYKRTKYRYYMNMHDAPFSEFSRTVEDYDVEFHRHLLEDSIAYCFSVLINPDAKFNEMHDFYFKIVYFYHRLGLVVYADETDRYREYIDEAAEGKDIALDDQHNRFLATSIVSSSLPPLDMEPLNKFMGKHTSSSGPRSADDVVSSSYSKPKKIRKVPPKILPVGHVIGTSRVTASVFEPDTNTWSQYTIPSRTFAEEENNIVVGYYTKKGMNIAFKVRNPKSMARVTSDSREKEKGMLCYAKPKSELQELCRKLDLPAKDTNVSLLCDAIKMDLMKREMVERRKLAHDPNHKKIRWFYMYYESQ